jgi:hypothetical protein
MAPYNTVFFDNLIYPTCFQITTAWQFWWVYSLSAEVYEIAVNNSAFIYSLDTYLTLCYYSRKNSMCTNSYSSPND